MDEVKTFYQCVICDEIFSEFDGLEKHNKIHIKKETDSIDDHNNAVLNDNLKDFQSNDPSNGKTNNFTQNTINEWNHIEFQTNAKDNKKSSSEAEQSALKISSVNSDDWRNSDAHIGLAVQENSCEQEIVNSHVSTVKNSDKLIILSDQSERKEERKKGKDDFWMRVQHPIGVPKSKEFDLKTETVEENVNVSADNNDGAERCNQSNSKSEMKGTMSSIDCSLNQISEGSETSGLVSVMSSTRKTLAQDEDSQSLPALECKVCGECFDSTDTFELHCKKHFKVDPKTSSKKPKVSQKKDLSSSEHICPQCNKKFTAMSSLKQHINLHSGEKPFKCTYCDKAFHKNNNLKQHIRTHTGEKPYKCDFCEKAFPKKENLKNHLRMHAGDKPFKCEECDRTFYDHIPLLVHSNSVHRDTSLKPLRCDKCHKGFDTERQLRHHLKIHNTDRPFKCEVCDKAFKEQGHLNRHIKIHSNIKAYKCEHCPKEFSQRTAFITHTRCHTGEKPFQCHICNNTLTTGYALKKHVLKHFHKKQLSFNQDVSK